MSVRYAFNSVLQMLGPKVHQESKPHRGKLEIAEELAIINWVICLGRL